MHVGRFHHLEIRPKMFGYIILVVEDKGADRFFVIDGKDAAPSLLA